MPGSRADLKRLPLPGRADERAADDVPGMPGALARRLAAVAGDRLGRFPGRDSKKARLVRPGRVGTERFRR